MEVQQFWLLQRVYNNDVTPIVIKEGLYKIGRSPESNILCKSEWVSRFHCDVTVKDGHVYIKDLGSLNGTFIKQAEIFKEREIELKHGDLISLGKPYLGGNPESDHYVYKLVACSAPQQDPQNRKRKASSSPAHESSEKRASLSPKRRRKSRAESGEEINVGIKKEDLIKEEDLVSLQEGGSIGTSNVQPSSSTRSSTLTSPPTSNGRAMVSDVPVECIDLTDDAVDNKSSFPNDISKSCSNTLLDSNVMNLDDEKVLEFVRKYIQNNESKLKTLLSQEDIRGEANPPIRRASDEVTSTCQTVSSETSDNFICPTAVLTENNANSNLEERANMLAIESKHVNVEKSDDYKGEIMLAFSSKENESNKDSSLRKSCLIPEVGNQDQLPKVGTVLLDKQSKSVSSEFQKHLKSSDGDLKSKINIETYKTTEVEGIDNFLKTCDNEQNNSKDPIISDSRDVHIFVDGIQESIKGDKRPDNDNTKNSYSDISVENRGTGTSTLSSQYKDITVANIKKENLSDDLVIDVETLFSQDPEAVVEIDSSGDELEYSQIFMEVDVQKEDNAKSNNDKEKVVVKEEFFYDIADENEDDDLFQSHFSQCSQEQDEISMSNDPMEKRKSISSSEGELSDTELQKSEMIMNLEKENQLNIKDVRIQLSRTEVESYARRNKSNLSPEKNCYGSEHMESAESNFNSKQTLMKESKFENFGPKDQCNNQQSSNILISDLDGHEIIKSDKESSVKVESLSVPKNSESKKRCAISDATNVVHHKGLAKTIDSKETEFNQKTGQLTQINAIGSTKESKKSIVHKNSSDLSKSKKKADKKLSPDDSNNAIDAKKVNSEKDLTTKQLKEEKKRSITGMKLPPPDSIPGSKLVKSTLLSKPPVERKKPGRPKKKESSVTKEAMKKEAQKRIVEDRKAKLKSIALKGKEIAPNGVDSSTGVEKISIKSNTSQLKENTSENISDSKIELIKETNDKNEVKSVKLAKITERNRSCILLDGFLHAPDSKKARTRRKVQKANSTASSEETCSSSANEPTVSDNKCTEITALKMEKEPCLLPAINGMKSCLKSKSSESSGKKVIFNPDVDVRIFECEGVLKSVNAMCSKDKVPPAPLPARSEALTSTITTLDETYFDIVHWNASWITEIKVVPGEPPVYVEKYNVKDTYVSYKDYKRWIYPLMLYELWGNMCKTMTDEDINKTGRTYDGIVLESLQFGVRTSKDKNLLVLKCFFPLFGKQVSNVVDPMDILLIKAFSTTQGKRVCFVLFGLVYSSVKITSFRETADPVARSFLGTLCSAPEACAYFDIIIYQSQQRPVTKGFQLRIRPTYNMINELRQFESLIKLASSPLSHIIFDPQKNNSVYLPKNLKDKVVSQYPLNDEQKNALLCTTQAVFAEKPCISLIHGPPGTGKSQVIVAIIEQLLFRFKLKNNSRRKKILICSQSNAAIDEICLRLLDIRKQLPREKRFKLTRFGRKERIHPRVLDIQTTMLARKEVEKRNLNDDFTLELSLHKATERMVASALENSSSPNVENYKRKYERVQKIIAGLEAIVNNKCSNEAKEKEIERLVFDEEMKVIYHSDIIATTLGSCSHKKIMKALSELSRSDERREIGVCIIDEATQATEADVLLPLVYDVKNFILVGDPQQLPPYVVSQTAKTCGLGISLFSRLYKVWGNEPSAPVYHLRTQYRMHPTIAHFPSKAFYQSQLNTPSFLDIKRPYKPYAVITHFFLQDSSETNMREASVVVEIAERLLSESDFKGLSLGMIVPYQRQRSIIQELLKDKKLMKQLTVNTIDSYQGQERDVIILSCVRTAGVGFLNDPQRMNVALTRAKKALYVIANFTSLVNTSMWSDLLSDARERNLHIEIDQSGNTNQLFDFLFERKSKKSRTSSS